jgi:hypothetical protein
MKQENLDFLEKQLTYHGFDKDVRSAVKEELLSAPKPAHDMNFKIKISSWPDKKEIDTNYLLHFDRKSDMVYFNHYTAALGDRELKINMRPGQNITVKEAFNLLQGRSVFRPEISSKECEKYSAWLKVDFSQKGENGQPKMNFYNQNYGFDLVAVLEKLKIKEMNDKKQRLHLIQSLERGNLQSAVMIDKKGNEQKVFIAAEPQFKNVNIYDPEGKRLFLKSDMLSTKETSQQGVSAPDKEVLSTIENAIARKEYYFTSVRESGINSLFSFKTLGERKEFNINNSSDSQMQTFKAITVQQALNNIYGQQANNIVQKQEVKTMKM